MKKRKLNNYFKFGILLVGILTILVNCDKDNFDDSSSFEDPSKPINKAIIVSHNEIPHIIDAVMELTGEKALKSAINFKTHKNRNAHIDIKKVLKVKNKEGFNNYTFRINVENNSSNIFYNMIVREEVDKKVKKPFIYKYVIDQDALPAFVASGNDMRYFKGMRYLLSYTKFLKEDKTINREPEQSETILEEECSNIENDGIPIVPQIIPISSSVGSGDPYYQYGGGYIYPLYYNPNQTYTYPNTSKDPQTNNTTPNNPVTGVYGTNAPTTSITSGGVDPQLNTGYPTYSNDYGGSFGNTTYNYNFILDDNGVVNIGNLDGGGGASCIQINIAYYGNYMIISVSPCNLMQYYAQRTALLDPDCPDPQGTIGVLTPENCSDGMVYDYNISSCVPLIDDAYIFTDNLIGKEKCLNDLLDKNGNTYVQNLLKNFRGDSEFDINIVSKDKIYNLQNKEINGQTRYKDNGNNIIDIEISTSKSNNNKALEVVRTILHEYIHADMYRKLYTKDLYTNEVLEFKETYNSFENKNFEPTLQHQTMSKLYLGEMTEAIRNFHQNVMIEDYNWLSDNGTKSLDGFYEALAWGGLRNHKVQAWLDKGKDTIDIINSLNNYYYETTNECPH